MLAARRYSKALIVVWAALLAGCNQGGPNVVPVSGVLTRDGKPVPNLEVYFMPTHGRNSVGMADENGRFKLGYTPDQDGALVATHTVFVVFNPPQTTSERLPAPVEMRPILEKYGSMDVSPLKVEITKAVSDLEIKLD